MITVDLGTLQAIMPRIGGAKGAKQAAIVAAIAPALQETLARYEINTPLRVAHFLAQAAHESDGFCTTEEYASGRAYEGRADLGNTKAGDGVRYKGRGLFQLTGRANYKAYGPKVGIPDLVDHPERAAEPVVSLMIACEYWKERRGGLNRFADQDDILTITKAINGGTNGLDDRRRYLAKAKQSLAAVVAIPIVAGQPAGARATVRRGSRGEDVKALQRQLSQAGYQVGLDGDFGPGTDAAVRAFQAKAGLGADGIVGPATWRALDSATPAGAGTTLIAEPKL